MLRDVFTIDRLAAAVVIAVGLAGTPAAQAQTCAACDQRPLLGQKLFGSKKPDCPGRHVNPVFDHKYIKRFCGPQVNAGTCFGFYHTQWRPWHEACGEPEPFNPGPTTYPSPPEGSDPEAEPKDVEKKSGENGKKDAEKKDAGNGKKDTDQPKKESAPIPPAKEAEKKGDSGRSAAVPAVPTLPPVQLPVIQLPVPGK